MKKKTFVTLFPDCPNFGLVKDVGQIPYYLSKYPDIEGCFASAKLDLNGDYVEEVDGLKLVLIPRVLHNCTLSGILYLIKNSRKIDILNIYHFRTRSYVYAKIYKSINKNGMIYLKLDAGFTTIDLIKSSRRYHRLCEKLMEISDVVSTESKTVLEQLRPLTRNEIQLVYNGTDIKESRNQPKDNSFLTVARIGSPEKNDELLLEAFSKIADKCDWNLILAGKIEDSFRGYIEEYFVKNPLLKSRIAFKGEVKDRKELAETYGSAKIFVLPSKFESYGLVCVEALINGCYLVLSDQVTPYYEFTYNGKYGTTARADDADDLAEKMLKATQNDFTERFCDECRTYAEKLFSWDEICNKIHSLIMKNVCQ